MSAPKRKDEIQEEDVAEELIEQGSVYGEGKAQNETLDELLESVNAAKERKRPKEASSKGSSQQLSRK